jgi:hypothetical protein
VRLFRQDEETLRVEVRSSLLVEQLLARPDIAGMVTGRPSGLSLLILPVSGAVQAHAHQDGVPGARPGGLRQGRRPRHLPAGVGAVGPAFRPETLPGGAADNYWAGGSPREVRASWCSRAVPARPSSAWP